MKESEFVQLLRGQLAIRIMRDAMSEPGSEQLGFEVEEIGPLFSPVGCVNVLRANGFLSSFVHQYSQHGFLNLITPKELETGRTEMYPQSHGTYKRDETSPNRPITWINLTYEEIRQNEILDDALIQLINDRKLIPLVGGDTQKEIDLLNRLTNR